MNGDKLYLTLI